MESTFKLSALGIQAGWDTQAVRAQLQPLLRGDPATFADIFHRLSLNEQVVLSTNLPKDKAERLLEKLTDIGLKCRMDPMALSLEPLGGGEYTCPACGHRQPRSFDDKPDICERCGIVGRNYEGASDLKRLVEIERQRLQAIKDQAEATTTKSTKDKTREQHEKLRAIAQRQVEKELGITPMVKLKAKLKSLHEQNVFIPIFGGSTAAIIGIGLLVWQLVLTPSKTVVTASTAKPPPQPAGLQITVKPAPDAVFKVEGSTPSATPADVDADAPGMAVAAANSPAGSEQGTLTATNAATSNATPAIESLSTPPVNSTPAQPQSLLDVNQLTLARPAAGNANGSGALGSAAQPPVRDPQVMNNLALYQISIGDIDAAVGSVDRAVEWVGNQKNRLSSSQLDQLNRFQVDIRARIASQRFKRQEPAIAQTQWFQATDLANSIVTPGERAQAFSKLARTLHEVQASTAKDYFSRALETTRLVADPMGQVVALSAVGRDLARTGRRQQSQDLFGQATLAVEALKAPSDRLVALAILAKHRAEGGDTTTAKSLLSTLAKQMESFRGQFPETLAQHRAEAFSALALNLAILRETAAAQSEFAAAFNQAEALTEPEMRANALLYLAQNLALAGDRQAAAKLAAAATPKD
ncbi:MAG: hypothetical protein KDJ28_08240 [Candidatus Competibacteraceae bacterium]|nr:hypothetical protein [Candidatus Competibacteraceae bacterium]